MSGLEIDFETRSDVDLKTRGVYNYMDSPLTDPLMASFSLDGGLVQRWLPGEPCPPAIVEHVTRGGMISAHNAQFERLLWQKILTPRYGWPVARTEQFRCTAATAAAMSLPRDLAGLGAALGLDVQKDTAGKALIRKFSLPRGMRKAETDDWNMSLDFCGGDPSAARERLLRFGRKAPIAPDDPRVWNEPEDFAPDFDAFRSYCDVDVETEAAADRRMVPLSADEQDLWVLDQCINDRGIRIDVASARAAIELAEKAKRKLDAEMRLTTGGYVGKCTEPAKLVEWVQNQGVTMDTAQKAEVETLLGRSDLPDHVRRAIELRQEAAKTSVAKLQAMLRRASADGRVRGAFIYHQASTGRWQSTGVNVANLPRPRKDYEAAIESGRLSPEILFDAFRTADPDVLSLMFGPKLGRPLHLVSDAIRGFLWAAPGKEFVQADYSGIEGAVAAWLAGEHWKVAALHEIAADPKLPDMYRRTAANIMGLTTDIVTKKHPLRQSVGKVSELALGYAGGVSAFYSMSQLYGVNLEGIFGPVWEAADAERRERASKRYERELRAGKSRTDVMTREAWIACEIVKLGWRETNPAISAAWKICEDAIREAIQRPGAVVRALKCDYVVKLGFLWCRLPSGRCLAYATPRLKEQVWASLRGIDGEWLPSEVMAREDAEKLVRVGEAKIEGETSPAATVVGVDGVTKQWKRFALYGGLAFQNLVQAIARDLLVSGMRKAEAAGYPVILHIYDEMVTEVPRGFGDLKAFERLICELPEWAKGRNGDLDLPLTAGGWRGKRYRKD